MTWPVTLKLDSAAYPLSVVQRAAYSLANTVAIQVGIDANQLSLTAHPAEARLIARTVHIDPTVRTVRTTAVRVAIALLATTAHPLLVPGATERRVLRAAPQTAIAFISRPALPAVQARALQRTARPMSRKATWSPVCRPR